MSKYLDEGRKVILWSGHPTTINQLADHFKKHKPYSIHGQMDFGGQTRDKFRDEMVEDFKQSKTRNVLIASYKVLNSAVNLVEASRNIYFDRSYSLTEWLQSQKRTHRIGQNERVITNPLIFENSLDVRLDHKLESKEDIDKKLLERRHLSTEEWKAIFAGDITI
jgi:SNF2 family DNA or RNA helicase